MKTQRVMDKTISPQPEGAQGATRATTESQKTDERKIMLNRDSLHEARGRKTA
jgi:hypothetical protein